MTFSKFPSSKNTWEKHSRGQNFLKAAYNGRSGSRTVLSASQLFPLRSVPNATDNHPPATDTIENNLGSAADDQLANSRLGSRRGWSLHLPARPAGWAGLFTPPGSGRMQSFIGESAGAPDGPGSIQNPTQGLVHGLFIGKGFRDFRLQHNDIGPFAKPL